MATLAQYLVPILMLAGLLGVLAVVLVIAERLLVNYGICRIDVNAGEQVLEVEGGQTLLTALQDAEISIPSACGGKGSCGYCKVTVASGGGQLLPTERPFLSRAEVRRGVRLACQVKIRNDIGITVPDFLDTIKRMVQDRTYNPDLRWHWQITPPPQPAREGPAEAPVPLPVHDTAEDVAFIEGVLDQYRGRESAPVPVLLAVNANYGYLPADVLRTTSAGLDVPMSQIYSLATFYNALSLRPRGRRMIRVCLGTACYVKGGAKLLEAVERELGIRVGETTDDLEFSLETVSCLGCCGQSPIITVDEDIYGYVKLKDIGKILNKYREAVPA